MSRRALPLALIAVVTVWLEPALAATEEPLRVTDEVNEVRPALGNDVLAWHQRVGERDADVYVQLGNGQPFQVNPGRSEGIMGGIDGNRLVYSQYPRKWPKRGDGDVRMVDLSTGARLPLHQKVNTKHEEYAPAISGDWLMLGRAKVGKRYVDRVLLINLATGERRSLDRITRKKPTLGVGHINGGYAVWELCVPDGSCEVFRYEISSGTTVQVPNPQGVLQYGPGVADGGLVYFFRSGTGCGNGVQLVRWSPSTGDEVVHEFPGGVDAHRAYVYDDPSDDRHIAYTRFTCGGGDPSDLYEIVE